MGLRQERWLGPDGESEHPVLEFPDWVDVVALTSGGEIVLVEQYRHPVRQVRLEFPAGAIEPDEPPLAAARRELREETGFVSDRWQRLGSAWVHPDVQSNRIHSFLALDARRIADQALDQGEMIRCVRLPFAVFVERLERGEVELPALQLAGLYLMTARLRRSAQGWLPALRARGGP